MNVSPGWPSERYDAGLICSWLKQAGRIALDKHELAHTLDLKHDDTPATAVDHEVEGFLLERIHAHHPGHQVVSEESGVHGMEHELLWVIDPLDGTRAYASGLPIWGISVGLLHNGEPLAGGFYMPAVDELYWGDENGAFLNGRPLSPPVASLDDPLAFLAVPSNSHLLYDISFHRLRSLGSTAAHLIYVARGAAVGALTRRVRIWDLAGVLPILQRLDIELRYLSGAPCRIGDLLDGQPAPGPLLAAPSSLINPLLAMIHPKRDAGLAA
jgi:myo-inositol-1(or 4)-monophosphatase